MWSITGKNINCLKYAQEQCQLFINLYDNCPNRLFQSSNQNLIIAAAHCGYLEGLLYIVEHWSTSPIDSTILSKACDCAAINGHLCCLKYLHEKGGLLTEMTANRAAEHGQLECLRYLHENGCPWNNAIQCGVLVSSGHFDCLQYLHENGVILL